MTTDAKPPKLLCRWCDSAMTWVTGNTLRCFNGDCPVGHVPREYVERPDQRHQSAEIARLEAQVDLEIDCGHRSLDAAEADRDGFARECIRQFAENMRTPCGDEAATYAIAAVKKAREGK